MVRIPLQYCGRAFGQALVDDDRDSLNSLGYFSVTLPRSLRQLARKRPDIILAVLAEDPSSRGQCRPFISFIGTQVLLVHMVLRKALAAVVLEHRKCPVMPTSMVRSELNGIRTSIGRVVHVNGDRTDCRLENLREL